MLLSRCGGGFVEGVGEFVIRALHVVFQALSEVKADVRVTDGTAEA